MTRPRIEPRSPGPLANTLTIMIISGYVSLTIQLDMSRLLTQLNHQTVLFLTNQSWHKSFVWTQFKRQTVLYDPLIIVCFVGFYGISTFVGYLTLNPFLCK